VFALAWLVEVGYAQTLGAKLIALAGDQALARPMRQRGRARVEEFSARRMVDRLAALYACLVESRVRR